MIGISKIEAEFIRTCLQKKMYFITNEDFCQNFSGLSKTACYQMLYRMRKKGLIFSIMNGQYLIKPIEEWFDGKLNKKTFLLGIISYLSSINAVLSGSTAVYFLKNKKLPASNWEVTTKKYITRNKTLKAKTLKQKLNFHYNKKIAHNFYLYKIEDLEKGQTLKALKITTETIPKGYFGVEKIDYLT